MSVREVLRMGHPLLREKARKLTDTEILNSQSLLQDMFDTMEKEQGIGIAAPQIGESLMAAIIKIPSDNPRYPNSEESETYIIFNPEIHILDQQLQGFWEGCLSVPGLRGFVERPRKVMIKYKNEKAENCEIVVEDFLATVFQHELDHLFGTLYVDRISDKTKLSFIEEFVQFHSQNGEEIDD